MATFHGKDGTVTFGTAIANVNSQSITVTRGTAEADVMGTDAIAQHAGHYSWTASVELKRDDTDALFSAATTTASASLVITAKTGVTYTGDAWLTGSGGDGNVSDTVNASLEFTGVGALVEAPTS